MHWSHIEYQCKNFIAFVTQFRLFCIGVLENGDYISHSIDKNKSSHRNEEISQDHAKYPETIFCFWIRYKNKFQIFYYSNLHFSYGEIIERQKGFPWTITQSERGGVIGEIAVTSWPCTFTTCKYFIPVFVLFKRSTEDQTLLSQFCSASINLFPALRWVCCNRGNLT